MKISATSGANSLAFSRRYKSNYNHHQRITYDTKKVRTALACIAAVGVAGITIALIKDAGNNSVKSAYKTVKETAKEIIPNPALLVVGNKRDAAAVSKYKAYTSKSKLGNLQKRITNGEFKDLPLHAQENIALQKAKLLKNANKL